MFKKIRQSILSHLRTILIEDNSGTAQRDPKKSSVKRVALRMGDVSSDDFEDPEYDFSQITTGYNTDSYIRQGVDKYIDQIFKEGYEFYGKNEQAIEYLKTRFKYMADVTGYPTEQMFVEIAEDVVKFSNCIIVKARMKDPLQLPQGINIVGLYDNEPVVGYFPVNISTIKIKRDQNGTIQQYQQEVDGADDPITFKPEDVIHVYYKREKGNAFGTPFLWPVLDDVRALRQAEENVLRMMYRSIYPFHHVTVGDSNAPGTSGEIEDVQDAIDNMDIDGGLVTSNRVQIQPIASNQVINAEPYIKHMENRVFSGMGIPAILFGRGDTANRSTGDNQSAEMNDRIKAIQRTICSFLNEFMIQELLLEGGFDPILNTDDNVIFRFKENDIDTMIKLENHVIYKFEHNAITEDEMRLGLSMDPISDRSLLNRELAAELSSRYSTQSNSTTTGNDGNEGGTKEGNNKNKPENQHGTKSSPKKTSDSIQLIDEILNNER